MFIMCDTDQAITWNKNCVMSWPGRAGRNKEKITSCSSLTRRVPDNGRTWTGEGGGGATYCSSYHTTHSESGGL